MAVPVEHSGKLAGVSQVVRGSLGKSWIEAELAAGRRHSGPDTVVET